MSRTQYNINQNLNNSQGKRQSTDDNPMMMILELPNKDFKAGIVTMFHEGRANSQMNGKTEVFTKEIETIKREINANL